MTEARSNKKVKHYFKQKLIAQKSIEPTRRHIIAFAEVVIIRSFLYLLEVLCDHLSVVPDRKDRGIRVTRRHRHRQPPRATAVLGERKDAVLVLSRASSEFGIQSVPDRRAVLVVQPHGQRTDGGNGLGP